MEYKIYKVHSSTGESKPSFLLGDVYFDLVVGFYREHAATLIIEGDKYRIEGKDEELKAHLIREIKSSGGNALERREGDCDGKYCVDYLVNTPFDHPEFKTALEDTLSSYGYTAVSPEVFDMVQVSSLEEAEKLRAEYLEEREKKENIEKKLKV